MSTYMYIYIHIYLHTYLCIHIHIHIAFIYQFIHTYWIVARNPCLAQYSHPLVEEGPDLCRGPLYRTLQSLERSVVAGSVARRPNSVADSIAKRPPGAATISI